MIDQAPNGNIYQHERRNVARLRQCFPTQFAEPTISIGWPDGWNDIVTQVMAQVDAQFPGLRWVQIKDKYGELRMYYRGGPLRIDFHIEKSGVVSGSLPSREGSKPKLEGIIQAAEEASLTTCSSCGDRSQVGQVWFDNWLYTLCPACVPRVQAWRALR